MYVLLLCIQLSIAIEAANKDSVTSSTVLSLARSSATLPSPRQSVQADQTGRRPSGDPVMTEVQECCPCWMKFCTCNCISKWKESRGYRAWRRMRHKIKKLVEHRYFEWAILLIIVASSITLVRAYAFPYITNYLITISIGGSTIGVLKSRFPAFFSSQSRHPALFYARIPIPSHFLTRFFS